MTGFTLGELLARVSAGSQSFQQRTGKVHGSLTPSDIAAAMAAVKSRPASQLVQAKYIDHDPDAFNPRILINEYQRSVPHNRASRRVDTIKKLANAVVKHYIREPRCSKCRGGGESWDRKTLRFVICTSCSGMGGKVPSTRAIARLSGMSRSKIKDHHIKAFWDMHQIMSTWEQVASSQIKRALRR